ncbi:MAG: ABC transporter ATP-binding protein [Acidobacteriota bacterium]
MFLWTGLLVIQGLLPIATVYLTRILVDDLVAVMGAGTIWPAARPLLLCVAAVAAVMLLDEIAEGLIEWTRTQQAELVKDHIAGLIHQKSISVDMAYYESPEYHDHMFRAQQEAQYRPVTLIEQAGAIFQNMITLIAMTAVLIPLGAWLPVVLLISTVPALYVVLRHGARMHESRVRMTADERRAWYYNWLLTNVVPASEIRIMALGDYFMQAYRGVRGRLRKESLRLERAAGLGELSAAVFGLLITAGAMGWMVWRAILGEISLGVLAFFYQAFTRGQGLMSNLLHNLGQIYGNTLFLGDLFEFLGLETRIRDPRQPRPAPTVLRHGIAFKNVTFRYPNGRRDVLRGLDLFIPAGKMVAVVGENGAGKTTLIKLVCRLYDPEQGGVELDGVDIRTLSVPELRRLVAVLFQEPVQYSASVAENIALGDLAGAPSRQAIEAAARAAGADGPVARLPEGYDTLLGKWFAGGTELSVGEWHRLALARAFLRQAPIMLLDEPTSAMDSWAEASWMDRFRDLAAGRTTLLITHRFTTAMRADIIHVMQQGRVVECGTHAELLSAGGRYATSWIAQMQERG